MPIPPGAGFSYDGLAGTNAMKVIGTSGNDAIGVNSTTFTVGSSTATYANVQTRIIDPLGGSDSVAIAGGLTVSFPGATPGGGIVIRNLSTVSLGSGSKLIVPTAASHSDRTLLVVQSATLGSSAAIDLGGNDADFTGTSLSTVYGWVKSGYNAGASYWAGSGLDSSAAAGVTTHLTALGVIQNNQSGAAIYGSGAGQMLFDGIAPGAGDTLVKYTYYGDANLDGKVDASDYSRIDNGYLNHLTSWYNGDFNYDGVVNGSDYTLIDNAFNMQGASLAASIASPTAAISGQSTTPTPHGTTAARSVIHDRAIIPTLERSGTAVSVPNVFNSTTMISMNNLLGESDYLLMQKKEGKRTGIAGHLRRIDLPEGPFLTSTFHRVPAD